MRPEDIKIALMLGTRPEIVKMSPVIRECERLDSNYFILHTGQHYSYNMDRVFFEKLQLPEPKYKLAIGSGTHAEETGKALIGIEEVIRKEKPSIVLVEGDTNTVLAGALAAVKLGTSVGHIEAGLRSYDKSMPEEVNRVLADHISDFLFAPTKKAGDNLLREGIASQNIYITGNTIVDCLMEQMPSLNSETDNVALGLAKRGYLLLTLHRQENVDNKSRLEELMRGLELVHEEFGYQIVFPIHPRTKKRMNEFGLTPARGLTLIEPIDYLTFLRLERWSKLILTDSGGVQEEACVLKVPCVTLRYNTERPETIDVGANVLAGTEPTQVLEKVKTMLNMNNDWENPLGDGTAAKQIIGIIVRDLANS